MNTYKITGIVCSECETSTGNLDVWLNEIAEGSNAEDAKENFFRENPKYDQPMTMISCDGVTRGVNGATFRCKEGYEIDVDIIND